MRDIFRRRRMWRPRPTLKDSYDVVIIGGGSHGLATAYYLRERGITDVCVLEKSYIGSGAAGRNTTILRSNYKTPEGARFYDASVKLYEGLSRELNFNLLFSQCGHLTLAHSDRALFVMANRAEVNRLQGIDSRLIGPDEVKRLAPAMYVGPDCDLSDHGRALPPARRHHPPRRRRLGPGPRRRRGRRGDPPLHRGPRPRAQQRARRRGAHQPRHDPRRAGGQLHGGLEHAAVRHGRRGAADHHPHPAGVRDRAGQAAARRGHRLLADARLRLADRPRRVPHGRRDRAVDDLPDAGHAELPAGGHAPHARALPPARARPAAALVGRACATSAPTTARSSARPRSTTSTSAPAGAPTASRPRRSSARRWPSSSTPAARRTSSPPSRSSASTRTASCPSSPPPPSATNRPWSHREEQPRDRTGRGPQADRADRRAGRPRRTRRSSPTGATRPRSTSACSTACSEAPNGKLVCVTGMTPTKAGEGKTTTAVGLTQGLGVIGKRPVLCLREPSLGPGVRHQGRRRRRRHDAGRPDGGPQPALHRRHPRHRRGQQPARRDARRLDPARQPACTSTRCASAGAARWT